jgi:hypothetical protein
MAGNYSAVARGFEAIAFNPANLALGNPTAFGLSVFSAGIRTGIDPIRLSDFKSHQKLLVPVATRERWLQQIGSGRERGGAAADLSLAALNIRNVGFQLGLVGTGEVNLNQDAAEALLFGNAGRTGTAKSFDFSGSNATGSLFGVGAMSIGIPVRTYANGDRIALGVTAKYIRGIASGRAMDNGSTTTPDNVNVQFPVIYTDSMHRGNAGSGIGMDIGASWTRERTTFSVTARNVLNSFGWSTTAFKSNRGEFLLDGTGSESSFDEAPYADAPAAMRAAFEREKFKPELAVGVAHSAGNWLVAADASRRGSGGIEIGPNTHVGVGAEYTGVQMLALRGGVAAITGGTQAAAGVGLHLGPTEISVGLMTRSMGSRRETGAVLSLISVR